jgi:hypothetical protein
VLLKRRKKLHLVFCGRTKKGLGFGKTEVAGSRVFRDRQTASKDKLCHALFGPDGWKSARVRSRGAAVRPAHGSNRSRNACRPNGKTRTAVYQSRHLFQLRPI